MYKIFRGAEASKGIIHNDWGFLQWVVSEGIGNSREMTVGKVVIKPGEENPRHGHFTCEETLLLLTGRLAHTVGDQTVILEPNDTLVVSPGVFHNAKNISDVDSEMIVAYSSGSRDFHLEKDRGRFVASPVCFPEYGLGDILSYYSSELNLHEFEMFTNDFVSSRFDISEDRVDEIKEILNRNGLNVHSFHLPEYRSDMHGESIGEIRKSIGIAKKLGAKILLFKAATKEDYIRSAPLLLPVITENELIPVLQNHCGSALQTIDDVEYVLDAIGKEELKVLLEVGHYVKAGVSWEEGLKRFKDKIALVHIKDMKGDACVTFGEGDVDFSRLFNLLGNIGYKGKFVVELETSRGGDRAAQKKSMERSLVYLADLLGRKNED